MENNLILVAINKEIEKGNINNIWDILYKHAKDSNGLIIDDIVKIKGRYERNEKSYHVENKISKAEYDAEYNKIINAIQYIVKSSNPVLKRGKRRKLMAIAAVISILVISFALIYIFNKKSDNKIIISKWIGYAPLIVADKKGWMPHWDLEYAVGLTGSEYWELINKSKNALYTTTIDGFYNSTSPDAFPQNSDNVKMIAVLDLSNGGDAIVVKPGIDSLKHLKGKKIGAWVGGPSQIYLIAVLNENNINVDSVNIISLPTPKLLEEFANGNLDAIATYSPYIEQAEEYGGHSITTSSDLKMPVIYDGLFMNKDNMLSDELLKELFSAWDKGVEFLKNESNIKESSEILELSVSNTKKALSSVKLYSTSEMYLQLENWDSIKNRVKNYSKQVGTYPLANKDLLEIDYSWIIKYMNYSKK